MMRHEVERRLRRAPKSEQRDTAFRQAIRSIPKGKVATYGQVAAAAGYPLYHRHVAPLLQKSGGAAPRGGGWWARAARSNSSLKRAWSNAHAWKWKACAFEASGWT